MNELFDLQDLVPDTLERAEVPFGEWLPDQAELNNPGAVEALNVIPGENCYVPFPQLELDGSKNVHIPVYGAAGVINADDIVQLFIGSTTGVITLDIGSNLPLVTANVSNQPWQFIRVNDVMVILHEDVFPYYVPFDTYPATLIGGSPPRAVCGAQVDDFLMLGNLLDDPDDSHGSFPSRVRWGGFNNINEPWVSDPATQADFQDLRSAWGPVRAIAGGTQGTIFQERAISVASYRGPPNIFDITLVEESRGAISRDCIIPVGPYKFFIAEDGFYYWNGTNSVPIGDNRVNRYFFKRLQYSERSRICGGVDFERGCVMWAFPIDTTGVLGEVIVYSFRENKWSHSIQMLEYLFNSSASNTTVDDMTGSEEGYSGSPEDPIYNSGGRSKLSAYDTAHNYGLFTGLPMAAAFDTAESTAPNGRRIFVTGVRPLIDLAVPVATVQLGVRDQMIGQPLVYTDAAVQEIDGQCSILGDARYMRFRVNVPAGVPWNHATGVEVLRKAVGTF